MESLPIASVVRFGWGNEDAELPIYTGGWFAAREMDRDWEEGNGCYVLGSGCLITRNFNTSILIKTQNNILVPPKDEYVKMHSTIKSML